MPHHPDRIQALNRANNGGRPTLTGINHPRALTGSRPSMASNRTHTNTQKNNMFATQPGQQIHQSHMSAGPQTSGQLE